MDDMNKYMNEIDTSKRDAGIVDCSQEEDVEDDEWKILKKGESVAEMDSGDITSVSGETYRINMQTKTNLMEEGETQKLQADEEHAKHAMTRSNTDEMDTTKTLEVDPNEVTSENLVHLQKESDTEEIKSFIGEHTVEKDISLSPMKGKETRNTIVLAISFLFVFTSYMAIQSLQGSLNDEGGLGVISLSCLYGANIISCIAAPSVVAVIGVKRVVVAAFVAHLIYDACNFYPSFATLVPSSVLLGAVTGPLWTSQGIYLATCAYSYAQGTGVAVYAALSRLNGIFWAIQDFSIVVGNIVSSVVLYQSQYNTTQANRSEYCGINDCPGTETVDIIADPEVVVIYVLFGIFLGCVLIGMINSFLFLSPIQSQGRSGKLSLGNLLFPLFKMIAKTDMKYLLPLTVYLAIAEEILFAEITKSYVSCPIGIQNVGYVMTAYGVSTIIAGFAFSRLAKYTARYVLLSLAGAVNLSLLVWIYHWIPTEHDTVLIYVLIVMWGIGDGLWKTQYNSLLGKHFTDNLDCVFAAAEGVKAIGFTLTFVYSSLLCMHVKVSIAIAFLVVGMALYYFVEIRFIRNMPTISHGSQ